MMMPSDAVIWPSGTAVAAAAAPAAGIGLERWYQRRITRQVHELAQEYGIGPSGPGLPRRIRPAEPADTPTTEPTQLSFI